MSYGDGAASKAVHCGESDKYGQRCADPAEALRPERSSISELSFSVSKRGTPLVKRSARLRAVQVLKDSR